MAVINIDDAYILGETGEQVDKVTGLFTKDEDTTSGEKAFAQLNIGTAGSNPNLLDNPWFTVRQRGDGPFSGANTEAVDRWRTTSNSTMTGTTDGITLTTTVRTLGMQQRVAKDFLVVGKTYTISAMEQDGTITSATFTWTGSGMSKYVTGANVGFEISVSNANYNRIYITTNYIGSVYLRAVKLELGSVSTLANDAPPDYGEELAKCQRYFWRLGNTRFLNICPSAMAEASGACFGICHLPVPMRAMPTISVKGSPVAWTGDGSVMSATSVTVVRNDSASPTVNPTFVGIRANGGDFTIGRRYDIQIRDDATAYVDFSADL